MRKVISVLLSMCMVIGMLTGCGAAVQAPTVGAATESSTGLPANEVLTSVAYDVEKPNLVVMVSDNMDLTHLHDNLQNAFPQWNIIFRFERDSAGGVLAHQADVYLFANPTLPSYVEECLLDVSDQESTGKYYATALQNCESFWDGKQYTLPLPTNVTGIVYNATLFQENGWAVPANYSEFVELCHTIDQADLGIRAFQPTFKFAVNVLQFGEAMNESNVFDTMDFFDWYEKYAGADGGGRSADFVLKPMLDTFQTLLDEEVIRLEDFTVKPPDRSNMMYTDRTAAMTIETQLAQQYAVDYGSTDTFGMIPFYSGDEEGDDYVISNPIAYLAVDRQVSEDSQKMDMIIEFLDYVATTQGQNAFVAENSVSINQLKDAETDYVENGILAGVESTIEEGRMVEISAIYKKSLAVSKSVFDNIVNSVFPTTRRSDAITGDATKLASYEEAVAYADEYNQKVGVAADSQELQTYATALENFTVLESSEYLAWMYQNQTGADIGLCLNNAVERGNCSAFWKGTVGQITDGLNICDSLAAFDFSGRGLVIDENDQKLVTVKMTGAQIREALERPENGGSQEFFEPFFVASGLKLEYAPWAEKGTRYQKITLADGSPLGEDTLYTVAAWNYTIPQDCITEYVKIYEESLPNLLQRQLIEDGEIAPFTDGRFVLNWEVN